VSGQTRPRLAVAGLVLAVLGVGLWALATFVPRQVNAAPGATGSLGSIPLSLDANVYGITYLSNETLAIARDDEILVMPPRPESSYVLIDRDGGQIRYLAPAPGDGLVYSDSLGFVREVSSVGTVTTELAPGLFGEQTTQNAIYGVAVSSQGIVYAADGGADPSYILAKTPSGRVVKFGTLLLPTEMEESPSGNVFVTDNSGNIYEVVREFHLKVVFNPRQAFPWEAHDAAVGVSFAFAPDGSLIASAGCELWRVTQATKIRIIGTSNVCESSANGTPVDVATIDWPGSMTVSPDYKLAFLDSPGIEELQLSP